MNQKYKYLVKNTAILAVCNFASKILVFLLVPLYTSVLTTEEYGIYDLVVNTASLLLPILSLNILDAMVRYELENKYDKGHITIVSLRYISISCGAVFLSCLLINKFKLIPAIAGMEWLICAYYFAYVCHQFFVQQARGMEKISQMGIAGVINTVVLVGSNILFLLVFKAGIQGFFVSTILSYLIPAIYLAVSTKIWTVIKKPFHYPPEIKGEMTRYSFPLIFSTLSWWVNSASDKYLVSFILGVAENGVLSVAYKIPSIINTLFGMFGQAWQISVVKEYNSDESKSFYETTIKCINSLTIISCGILIALSQFLGKILYSNEFFRAWELAPFLIISTVFNSASGLLGPVLSAIKDTKSMAKSAIYGASANIILNVVLIYLIGTQGAAIATVISAGIIYTIRKMAVIKKITLQKDFVLWCSVAILVVESILVIGSFHRVWIAASVVVLAIVNSSNLGRVFSRIFDIIRRKVKRDGKQK